MNSNSLPDSKGTLSALVAGKQRTAKQAMSSEPLEIIEPLESSSEPPNSSGLPERSRSSDYKLTVMLSFKTMIVFNGSAKGPLDRRVRDILFIASLFFPYCLNSKVQRYVNEYVMVF